MITLGRRSCLWQWKANHKTHMNARNKTRSPAVTRVTSLGRYLRCVLGSVVLILATSQAATAATVNVTVGGDGPVFTPSFVTIHPGDTVKWTWDTSAVFPHSVTSGNNGTFNGLFESGVHNEPFTFSFTFPNAGTFNYFCRTHFSCCLMTGRVTVAGSAHTTPTPTPTPTPPAEDFNGDRKPDYALFHSSDRKTALWYLNGAAHVGSAYGPTLSAGWVLADSGDFNGNGKNDYVLFNPSTRQTAIWFLVNATFTSGTFGPTLPAGWTLAGGCKLQSSE